MNMKDLIFQNIHKYNIHIFLQKYKNIINGYSEKKIFIDSILFPRHH